ncbi:hypothetical protein GCM10015535_68780 [Streptomyces gelaticus]|uniref:Protein kinase domain-containing protein n=1 Tax=Streptomyces gelaticus TaxID=285446 RepID=A0ABQ2WBX7_9ACTN|nr:hypothetical protein GCM10015535_68780 [Streptomyces gelaticus]
MEPPAAGDPVRVGVSCCVAGGTGEAFLGRSPGGKAVAVKVVHPHLARQAEFRHRFRREVAAARAVSGAFTAPVVAAGPEDDTRPPTHLGHGARSRPHPPSAPRTAPFYLGKILVNQHRMYLSVLMSL